MGTASFAAELKFQIIAVCSCSKDIEDSPARAYEIMNVKISRYGEGFAQKKFHFIMFRSANSNFKSNIFMYKECK